MKVMITGGTGFIGSYLVKRLLDEGNEVTVLARDPSLVPGFSELANLRFVEGSITDDAAVRAALDGADACVHVALGRGETAADWIEADTLPALRIFEAAADLGVRNLVHTSSIAVYDGYHGRFNDGQPTNPIRYYGATKAAVEDYLLALGEVRNVRVGIVRPGYTFGNPVVAGARTQKMPELPGIVAKALVGEPIEVRGGTGLQFIWAGDLVSIYSALLNSEVDRAAFTSVSANATSWEQVARWAVELTGSSSEIVITDGETAAIEATNDVSAIAESFGLSFNSDERLKEHLSYWAETLR